jgi:hypothetical protein
MRRLKLVNVRQLVAVSLLLSLLICEAVGITQELVYPPKAPKILSDYGDWSGVRGGRRDQEHAGIDFCWARRKQSVCRCRCSGISNC